MTEVISIKAQEIQEWLILRRKLDKNWFMKFNAVLSQQEKIINEVKREVTDERVKNLLKDEDKLDFLKLLQLNELLIDSDEGKKRNLFNQYSSPHIKNVTALIKLYKKNSYDIASLAKELNEILQYKLVSNRKLIKENNETTKEFQYKIQSAESSIIHQKKEVIKVINKYNEEFEIEENDVEKFSFERFVRDLVYLLPKWIKILEDSITKEQIEIIVEYYQRFSGINRCDKNSKEMDFKLLLDFAEKKDHFDNGKSIQNSSVYYNNYLKRKGYYKDDDLSIFTQDDSLNTEQSDM